MSVTLVPSLPSLPTVPSAPSAPLDVLGVPGEINLDYAATAPCARAAADAVAELLPWYASVHRGAERCRGAAPSRTSRPGRRSATSSARAPRIT